MQDEPINSPPPVALVPQDLPPAAEPQPDPAAGDTAANPAWAKDLRQLYNAVVEEPLPDTFLDLLSKLDSED